MFPCVLEKQNTFTTKNLTNQTLLGEIGTLPGLQSKFLGRKLFLPAKLPSSRTNPQEKLPTNLHRHKQIQTPKRAESLCPENDLPTNRPML